MDVKTQIIHTLVGHQQVKVALRCLPSLCRNSDKPVSLVAHDDGTLTREDEALLAEAIDRITIVWRSEADNAMEALLVNYPRCRAYRCESPLALKLLDCALLSSRNLAYCDSDILFIKPFANLFPAAPEEACIFMQDRQEAYALRPWHVSPLGKIKALRQVNTGLIHFCGLDLDLDYIEYFLGRRSLQAIFAKRPQWIEQTCWAAIEAHRKGCLYDAKQIIIANPDMEPVSPEVVGIHFVSTHRDLLKNFPEDAPLPDQNHERATIRIKRAQFTNSARMLASDLRKRSGK